ncbi:EamA family transporter RarD [Nocardiopsis suaedae]|uniref:EamA family transporter RarD n=1 Tax=Nocardiopsis suaedae TaxID=3018444 RepID=A0ABT4TJL4_9ACTN|nr:EamA family transporter RarD [Nocardiopsis suaedae]MDA2804605.1 EamA family transporter RarD [Nocardiopsis suaedae]
MSETDRGVLFGASAYLMWGLTTLYWPLLEPSAPLEILAHRMVWSLLVVGLLLSLRRGWRPILAALRTPRQLLVLGAAAAVISANWGLFIVAVNSGQTSQAALGYFINPLVSVVLGVLVFSERLRPAQWTAIALGAAAVAVLTYAYGGVPWYSLGMALSFATYGLVKRFTTLDGLQSLTVETLLMLLPALAYVAHLESSGAGTFVSLSPAHTALLIGSGLATAVPLMCFGAANRRIPLSMIGLLQFVVPVMQFLFAWLIFDEPLPLSRWIGFGIVWAALVVFATDMLRNARRNPRPGREKGEEEQGADPGGAGERPAAQPN